MWEWWGFSIESKYFPSSIGDPVVACLRQQATSPLASSIRKGEDLKEQLHVAVSQVHGVDVIR